MIRVIINGNEFEAQPGDTVLAVARTAGIDIPTLCYHPATTPDGSCRLCLVEVSLQGRTRIVTSCCYPARDGLQVHTDTPRVQRARRGVMELLLARAPESEYLRALAASMGVTETRFPTVTHAQRDCILCGLCVSVCREIIGGAAISFANRGVNRTVAAPFLEPSEACVGCGACEAVCPVGTIRLRWTEAEVEVSPFKTRVALVRCEECGVAITGEPFSRQVRERLGEKLAHAARLCDACKRKHTAVVAQQTAHAHTGPSADT